MRKAPAVGFVSPLMPQPEPPVKSTFGRWERLKEMQNLNNGRLVNGDSGLFSFASQRHHPLNRLPESRFSVVGDSFIRSAHQLTHWRQGHADVSVGALFARTGTTAGEASSFVYGFADSYYTSGPHRYCHEIHLCITMMVGGCRPLCEVVRDEQAVRSRLQFLNEAPGIIPARTDIQRGVSVWFDEQVGFNANAKAGRGGGCWRRSCRTSAQTVHGVGVFTVLSPTYRASDTDKKTLCTYQRFINVFFKDGCSKRGLNELPWILEHEAGDVGKLGLKSRLLFTPFGFHYA